MLYNAYEFFDRRYVKRSDQKNKKILNFTLLLCCQTQRTHKEIRDANSHGNAHAASHLMCILMNSLTKSTTTTAATATTTCSRGSVAADLPFSLLSPAPQVDWSRGHCEAVVSPRLRVHVCWAHCVAVGTIDRLKCSAPSRSTLVG